MHGTFYVVQMLGTYGRISRNVPGRMDIKDIREK